jgi:hypothetical protein
VVAGRGLLIGAISSARGSMNEMGIYLSSYPTCSSQPQSCSWACEDEAQPLQGRQSGLVPTARPDRREPGAPAYVSVAAPDAERAGLLMSGKRLEAERSDSYCCARSWTWRAAPSCWDDVVRFAK